MISVLHVMSAKTNEGNGTFAVVDMLVREQNKQGLNADMFAINPTKRDFDYTVITSMKEVMQKMRRRRYDIIVFHGLFFWKIVFLGIYVCLFRIPFLIKPHSGLMRHALKKGSIKKHIYIILILRPLLFMSQGFLFINNDEHKNSVRLKRKYFIEPNGLEMQERRAVKKEHGDKLRLFYLGRIDYIHKGIDLLIGSLRILENEGYAEACDFRIYGTGSEKDIGRIRSDMRSFPTSFVRYCGPVFKEEKERVLRESNIIVLTSRYEGFPTVIMEALSYGIPCVCTEGTNASEIVERKLGWMAKANPVSIAETIKEAMRDYGQNQERYIKAAQRFALRNYDISIAAQKSIRNYHEVCGKSKR